MGKTDYELMLFFSFLLFTQIDLTKLSKRNKIATNYPTKAYLARKKGVVLMALLRGTQDTPASNIVELIQRHGPLSIKDIEERVGVTKTAVRQQLTNLMAEGLIATRLVREGVGRPHYVYLLTNKAREMFSCYCDEVVLSLYEELVAEIGPSQMANLLSRVGSRLASQYHQRLKGNRLAERIQSLASVLDERGILIDLHATEDGFVLKEYNCPYHELAQEHREICDMEQNMMSEVLSADVELTQCMMDGHNGCQFTVSPKLPVHALTA